MRILPLLLAVLLAAPLTAQPFPGPDFFAGSYEVTGRSPGADGLPFSDWLHIQPEAGAEPDRMILSSCRSGTGGLWPAQLVHEGQAPYEGRLGDWQLFCRFATDSDNYPRLTCYALDSETDEIPGLLTFWPAHWPTPAHAASCD